MKTFPSSALSNNRSEVMKAARDGGAVIQLKETNGDVREEFVMIPYCEESIFNLYQMERDDD